MQSSIVCTVHCECSLFFDTGLSDSSAWWLLRTLLQWSTLLAALEVVSTAARHLALFSGSTGSNKLCYAC